MNIYKADLRFVSKKAETLIEKLLDSMIEDRVLLDFHDVSIISLSISIIELAREALILLDYRKAAALPLICRAAIEKHVYLKYILQKNTETRGKLYLLHSRIESINAFQLFTSDTERGRRIRLEFELDLDTILKRAQKIHEKSEIRRHRNLDDQIRSVRNNYRETLGADKRKWHYEAGKNIKDVFAAVGMDSVYDSLYTLLSHQVHGDPDQNHKMVINKGQFHWAIYRPGEMEIFLLPFIKNTIIYLLTYYEEPDMLKDFTKLTDFAMRFHRMQKLKRK